MLLLPLVFPSFYSEKLCVLFIDGKFCYGDATLEYSPLGETTSVVGSYIFLLMFTEEALLWFFVLLAFSFKKSSSDGLKPNYWITSFLS
jgi:hypothetical protein